MITLGRLGTRDTRHRRTWLGLGLVLLVLAVSIPLGLNALRPPSPASTGSLMPASGGSFEQSPGLGSDAGAAPPATPDAADGLAREGTTANGKSGSAVPSVGAKLARTAWLGVKVTNITKASAQVRAIAVAAGGQVLSESIVTA
ncbi:MAG TPA: hypothetical protein VFG98_12460, partial [Intrasporangium sp.]|nr:hypothetical protein [Intrasporangium sp.]